MIGLADPHATGETEIEPRRLLQTATEVAEQRLAGSAKALTETLSTIAVAYQGLGDHEAALSAWRRVCELANSSEELPLDYSVRARFGHATALSNLGRPEAALAELEDGLADARARGLVEVEADFHYGVAVVRFRAKDWRDASTACDAAIALFERVPPARKFAECLMLRALLDKKRRRPDLAGPQLRRAIAIETESWARAGVLATLRLHLAGLVHDHDPVAAERLYREALPFYAGVLRKDENYADLMAGLGNVLRMQGRNGEGEPFLRRAFEVVDKKLDGEHPNYHSILGSFAGVLIDLGRNPEARRVLESGVDKLRGGQRRVVLHEIAELQRSESSGHR
jgi:tetratricopeptide (TPR) repeat protein